MGPGVRRDDADMWSQQIIRSARGTKALLTSASAPHRERTAAGHRSRRRRSRPGLPATLAPRARGPERSTDRLCIHAVEEFPHRRYRAGVGRDVAGKGCDGLVKFMAFHDVEHPPHRLGLQKRAAADEEIILGQEPDEIEPELPRRGLDA